MNVGFVGAGHIATALGRGWSASRSAGAPFMRFFDVVPGKAALAAEASGGAVCATLVDLVTASDVLIVAVRPADVRGVLAEAGPLLDGRGVISVAAGVTLAGVSDALPAGARAGRLMPSISAELGLGVFLFSPGSLGTLAAEMERVLGLIGTTVALDEALFDVATALTGCMPGFMACILEAFEKAGRDGGLDEETARTLTVAAAHGATAMIAKVGDPITVMIATATPGGMTSAGLAHLSRGELAAAIEGAVEAAAARAKELA